MEGISAMKNKHKKQILQYLSFNKNKYEMNMLNAGKVYQIRSGEEMFR